MLVQPGFVCEVRNSRRKGVSRQHSVREGYAACWQWHDVCAGARCLKRRSIGIRLRNLSRDFENLIDLITSNPTDTIGQLIILCGLQSHQMVTEAEAELTGQGAPSRYPRIMVLAEVLRPVSRARAPRHSWMACSTADLPLPLAPQMSTRLGLRPPPPRPPSSPDHRLPCGEAGPL